MNRVLYVGSGFCSAKGLARELPEQLLNHQVNVDVVVPHVKGIDEGAGRLAERLIDCVCKVDGSEHHVKVLEGRSEGHVRTFYMDDCALENGLNLDSDEGIRACAVFAHAVCCWIANGPVRYDVIHCDGLATALIPMMMRRVYMNSENVKNAKSVSFVAGTEDKGSIDMSWLSRMGLPSDLASSEGMEFYGRLSVLKGAYLYADALAFPNDLVREGIEKNRGKDIGMEGVLFSRLDRIHTIGLGCGCKKSGPDKDTAIECTYSVADMNGKKSCKAALAQKLHIKKDRPMVAFIGRLDSESGIDLVNDILDDLMDRKVSLVIAGQGNEAYQSAIEGWKDEFKGCVAWMNEDMKCEDVRRLLSAADILLMPAKHESTCRLHQVAMKYGCVVVARAQGCAAHDIHGVRNLDKLGAEDNGFTFVHYDSDEFFEAAMDALDVYASSSWNELRDNAMKTCFCMCKTAQDCVRIYESL